VAGDLNTTAFVVT